MKETSDKKNLVKSYDLANSILPKELPFITYKEADKAARLLAKKFGKLKDAAPTRYRNYPTNIRIRKCWICLSGDSSTLHRGWRRLIHDMAHRLFRYRSPNMPDHCKLQADFEAEMVSYVNQSGWLNGLLKPKAKPKLSNDEKRNIKIIRLKENILRWETKIKRGNTYLKKYKTKLKRLSN
ncbi:hypothetical protein [uncultured Mediterranean phage uvMED]|jgi:predicted DNA-binding antitoxin AbrB/MazE fold protein|nr:hypothetical protein [uncultured Mediterranean phage uvMED]|tara:strand:+ start:21 stop:563 length:543 start_codon:yes stop_codon:yes gene_type:complete